MTAAITDTATAAHPESMTRGYRHPPTREAAMDTEDVSAHRTRTNRRPDPPLHPATVAEINDAMDDVVQDRD
jgi:hypothetical protein